MSLRVISGSARGRKLKLVPGDTTRPIMDRVKEALFNILGRRVLDAQMLDMFAGTGSVGIEALSRGAAHCLFLDLERRAVETIQANLALCGFTDRATVRRADAFSVLRSTPTPCDLVYIAPPQYKTLWLDALKAVDDSPGWVKPDGVLVVQIDPTERQSVALKHFTAYDERTYGSTLLWFFQPNESDDPSSDQPVQGDEA